MQLDQNFTFSFLRAHATVKKFDSSKWKIYETVIFLNTCKKERKNIKSLINIYSK